MTGLYWDEDDGQEGLLTRRSAEHCLTEQEIEEYLFNRLSGVTREAVEEHLLFCEQCLRKVEEEEQYLETMRRAAEKLETESLFRPAPEGEAVPAVGAGWSLPRWGYAVATLAVVMAGASVAYRMTHRPQPVEIFLEAERSGVEKAFAPRAGQPLAITADLRGLPPLEQFRYSVVDALGAPVASGMMQPNGESGRIELAKGLPPGVYWVRIHDPESGALLREFGLPVADKAR
jgi:hypothetical protein